MLVGRAGVRQTRNESRRGRGGGELTTVGTGLQPARVSGQTTQSWLSQGDTDPPAPVSHWLEVAPEK